MTVSTTGEGSDIQDFAGIQAPAYQTLWIARKAAGELKVLVTLPELIVPRSDGFWHVGVAQVCEFESGNESLRHVVWAAPVTKAGEVAQASPCTPHKPEDYAGPYGRSEEDKDKISQCGVQLTNFLYLSPQILSTSTYTSQSEECEPRGGRYTTDFMVRRPGSEDPVPLGDLLGPQAKLAFARALPKHGSGDMEDDCGETHPGDDRGWRISHEKGRWRPYLHQDLGYFGCSADALVRFPLPASLTGDTSPAPDMKLLKSRIPAVADAFVSPAGDLLIALSRSETSFYELRDGVPGKLLLKLPPAEIVMAQWATGNHVQDWTQQISELAGKALPPPVIRVKSAGQ